MKNYKSELIPQIETEYSWHWNCPAEGCIGRNEIERDGDCFPTPLKCDECGTEFDNYGEEQPPTNKEKEI